MVFPELCPRNSANVTSLPDPRGSDPLGRLGPTIRSLLLSCRSLIMSHGNAASKYHRWLFPPFQGYCHISVPGFVENPGSSRTSPLCWLTIL